MHDSVKVQELEAANDVGEVKHGDMVMKSTVTIFGHPVAQVSGRTVFKNQVYIAVILERVDDVYNVAVPGKVVED